MNQRRRGEIWKGSRRRDSNHLFTGAITILYGRPVLVQAPPEPVVHSNSSPSSSHPYATERHCVELAIRAFRVIRKSPVTSDATGSVTLPYVLGSDIPVNGTRSLKSPAGLGFSQWVSRSVTLQGRRYEWKLAKNSQC